MCVRAEAVARRLPGVSPSAAAGCRGSGPRRTHGASMRALRQSSLQVRKTAYFVGRPSRRSDSNRGPADYESPSASPPMSTPSIFLGNLAISCLPRSVFSAGVRRLVRQHCASAGGQISRKSLGGRFVRLDLRRLYRLTQRMRSLSIIECRTHVRASTDSRREVTP